MRGIFRSSHWIFLIISLAYSSAMFSAVAPILSNLGNLLTIAPRAVPDKCGNAKIFCIPIFLHIGKATRLWPKGSKSRGFSNVFCFRRFSKRWPFALPLAVFCRIKDGFLCCKRPPFAWRLAVGSHVLRNMLVFIRLCRNGKTACRESRTAMV